jgi:hypothetical protein
VIRNYKFDKAAENVNALNNELEERNKKFGRGNPSVWPLGAPKNLDGTHQDKEEDYMVRGLTDCGFHVTLIDMNK